MLPTLKPLVFEGKSGVMLVRHKYNDQAQLFIKEGIIEGIETTTLNGKQAALTCSRWVNISTSFKEGSPGKFTPDQGINTNSFLSFLKKTANTIAVISKKIPDDTLILQMNPTKLSQTNKLNANDLKIALLLDGNRSIEDVLAIAGKPELPVLTHICRLILAGVTEEVVRKDVMVKHERTDFLDSLNDQLTELVGPVASILVEDAFEAIESQPDMLTKEEIPQLSTAISTHLDAADKSELHRWTTGYLSR